MDSAAGRRVKKNISHRIFTIIIIVIIFFYFFVCRPKGFSWNKRFHFFFFLPFFDTVRKGGRAIITANNIAILLLLFFSILSIYIYIQYNEISQRRIRYSESAEKNKKKTFFALYKVNASVLMKIVVRIRSGDGH